MYNRPPPDLFTRLPGHIRSRDAEEGRPLEALFKVFADELGIIERDLDQLYDNWFVETCEPWVLPYIAALVGATPMRDIGADQAGLLRAYIANVLQYRQAKGTAAVVEQVARDVSGWPVVAVEFFQRLATSQNVNHLRPSNVVFPSVKDAPAVSDSRGPFSTMAHGPAAGAPAGWSGRYNIPHLGLFVWRQAAMPIWPVENDPAAYIGGAQALPDGAAVGLLRFDPLGRDLGLVNRASADISVAARMTPRTVPLALSRAEVHAALNLARETGETPGRWFEESPPFRVRLGGVDLDPAQIHGCNLSRTEGGDFRRPDQAGEVLVDPELGRIALHPDDEGQPVETGFAYGAAFDIGGGPYDRRESLDAWLPEFVVPGEEEATWQIGVTQIAAHVTDNPDQGGPVVGNMRDAVQRWNIHAQANPGARGIIVVMDNANYDEALNALRRIFVPPGARLAIVAAAWPAVEIGGGAFRRTPGRVSPQQRRPVLNGPVMIDGLEAGQDEGGLVVIDGLAIRGKVQLRDGGDLGDLRLYNCTVGAGGGTLTAQVICNADNARASVLLHRCIVGGVALPTLAAGLSITRSIIGEDLTADGGAPAALRINAPAMDLEIAGSTVFGRIACRTIEAENSILLGRAVPDHRQEGCVRFCYVTRNSPLPQRYKCVPRASDPTTLRPVFTSTRFQDPGFAQLSLRTSSAISEGAEDGMEMGVGFANRNPARYANLEDAVSEFAPFGLAAGVIFMT